MRKTMIIGSLLVWIFMGLTTAMAQWEVFDCSVLPQYADQGWHESNATNDDNFTEVLYVETDPDIPGNKLLILDTREAGASLKEMWQKDWGGAATPGMTLVFRVAALDTSEFTRDLDVYMLNGLAEERLISSNMGARLKFDRSGAETFITPLNLTEWHVIRITISGSAFELFLDEDQLSYMNTTGIPTADKYFRFGDGGTYLYGAKYDWIAWDTTGAYPPGYGTPLPDSLFVSPPVAVEEEVTLQPTGFSLSQNYPNPFNPITDIPFSVGEAVLVRLDIYDLTGHLVRALVNERKQPGTYIAAWDGHDMHGKRLHSGVYLYTLHAGDTRSTRKMLLLK